jgi:hypothetical protein
MSVGMGRIATTGYRFGDDTAPGSSAGRGVREGVSSEGRTGLGVGTSATGATMKFTGVPLACNSHTLLRRTGTFFTECLEGCSSRFGFTLWILLPTPSAQAALICASLSLKDSEATLS